MSSHYDKKASGHHNNRGHGYTIRTTNIQHASNILESDSPSDDDSATDEVHETYHIDVNNTVDEVHQRCFNCGINGHLWQDYKEPLKESLRNALKATNAWLAWEKDQLNKTGGTGKKGDCSPSRSDGQGPTSSGQSLRNSIHLLE